MELKLFIKQQLQTRQKHTKTIIERVFPDEYKVIVEKTDFLEQKIPLLARYFCILNSIKTHPTCKVCSAHTKWGRLWEKGFLTYCSPRCKNLDPEQQQKNQIGKRRKYKDPAFVQRVIRKRNQTFQERYNGHPSKTKEVKYRTIQTNLKKYGKNYAQQLEKTQQKTKETNLRRYGVEYVMQNLNVKRRRIENNNKKYKVNYPIQSHIDSMLYNNLTNTEWLYDQHVIQQKSLLQIGDENNIDSTTLKRYIDKAGIVLQRFSKSQGEKQLSSFLKSLGVCVQENVKLIYPFEVDSYLPDYNLAFEYNGLFWHSELMGKHQWYHKTKTDLCEKQGVRLIHIFEDQWIGKNEIVKNMILYVLGLTKSKVYARNTNVVNVDNKTRKEFFNQTHIQGDGSGSITYGLEHNDKLVALITFKKTSKGYLLNRFSTSCVVVGGFSKLLAHFKKNHFGNITTFVDLTWSQGDLYVRTGFTEDKQLLPDYKYIINNKRYHKFGFRHKHLPHKLSHYDSSLSEKQNCDNNGLLKIWDCGKKRYILQQEPTLMIKPRPTGSV